MTLMGRKPSQWHQFRSSKSFIYVVVNLAVFTDAYLYGLIIPVLPFVLTDLIHVPPADVQKWIGVLLGAYGGGLLIGSPVAGYLADNSRSRRATYMLGLVALGASTAMFSIGRSVAVLTIARLLQGFQKWPATSSDSPFPTKLTRNLAIGSSSAFVHCVGMVRYSSAKWLDLLIDQIQSILADTAGEGGIGAAMGFVTMMIALGMVTGPACGGFLYHKYGYLAVFLSAYALVGVDLLFRLLMLERKTKEIADPTFEPGCNHRSDTAEGYAPRYKYGVIEGSTETVSPTAASPGGITTPSSTYSSSTFAAPPTETSLLLPSPDPTYPNPSAYRSPLLILLSKPRMLAAILGSLMESFLLTELEATLPLYIKHTFGYNASQIGLVFLVTSLPSFFAPLIGRISDRQLGARTVVTAGFLVLCPFWLSLQFVEHRSTEQVALLCLLLFAIGVALNMVLTPVFTETKEVVDEAERKDKGVFGEKGAYAQAFGLMNMAYAAGSMIGPLVGGLLVEKTGWGGSTRVTGVVCLVCAVPMWLASGERKGTEEAVDGEIDA